MHWNHTGCLELVDTTWYQPIWFLVRCKSSLVSQAGRQTAKKRDSTANLKQSTATCIIQKQFIHDLPSHSNTAKRSKAMTDVLDKLRVATVCCLSGSVMAKHFQTQSNWHTFHERMRSQVWHLVTRKRMLARLKKCEGNTVQSERKWKSIKHANSAMRWRTIQLQMTATWGPDAGVQAPLH